MQQAGKQTGRQKAGGGGGCGGRSLLTEGFLCGCDCVQLLRRVSHLVTSLYFVARWRAQANVLAHFPTQRLAELQLWWSGDLMPSRLVEALPRFRQRLTSLHIQSDGWMPEELGASLAQMTQLEFLSIAAVRDMPTNLGDGLSRLTSLKELCMECTQGGVPILTPAAMAQLEHLRCATAAELSDEFIHNISQAAQLVTLGLIALGPSAWPALQPLTALEELEELVLEDDWVKYSYRGAEQRMRVPLLAGFPWLQRFHFSGSPLVRLWLGWAGLGAELCTGYWALHATELCAVAAAAADEECSFSAACVL